jgi:hypothetical protein
MIVLANNRSINSLSIPAMDAAGNPDDNSCYAMESTFSNAAKEPGNSGEDEQRLNTPSPIALQTTEDPPLSTNLKGWMVCQVYRHYLEELMAMHSSLSRMSSMDEKKIIISSGDSSDSS